MITMKNWRERMGEDMRLRDDRRQAPSSINIAICALRFFFNFTLQRDYEVFALLRVNRPRSLPVVLSRAEVKRLLGTVQHPVRRMALTTIYGLGLRLGEGLHLQTSHIDSARQMVWVRSGKGAKDRRVPLPTPLLLRLRHYWKHDRPASSLPLLFVSAEGGTRHLATNDSGRAWAQEPAHHRGVHARNGSRHRAAAGSARPVDGRPLATVASCSGLPMSCGATGLRTWHATATPCCRATCARYGPSRCVVHPRWADTVPVVRSAGRSTCCITRAGTERVRNAVAMPPSDG
jgi:integrase